MGKTEWWEAVLLDDETGEVIYNWQNLTLGELGLLFHNWNDEQLILMRASLCFGRVD